MEINWKEAAKSAAKFALMFVIALAVVNRVAKKSETVRGLLAA